MRCDPISSAAGKAASSKLVGLRSCSEPSARKIDSSVRTDDQQSNGGRLACHGGIDRMLSDNQKAAAQPIVNFIIEDG
jgi:hypothetical protein